MSASYRLVWKCVKCKELTAEYPKHERPSCCSQCDGTLFEPVKVHKPLPKDIHLVACNGEAHSNGYIDNCMLCAPRWGWLELPKEYKTLEAYQDAYHDGKKVG